MLSPRHSYQLVPHIREQHQGKWICKFWISYLEPVDIVSQHKAVQTLTACLFLSFDHKCTQPSSNYSATRSPWHLNTFKADLVNKVLSLMQIHYGIKQQQKKICRACFSYGCGQCIKWTMSVRRPPICFTYSAGDFASSLDNKWSLNPMRCNYWRPWFTEESRKLHSSWIQSYFCAGGKKRKETNEIF